VKILLHSAANQLNWQHFVAVASIGWRMDSSVRAHSQPQRHFHETDGFTSYLVPQSLYPVLCWEFSEAWQVTLIG